jgi:hypothetical protein
MSVSNKDRNLLDVVQEVTKDLRHNQTFVDQLTKLDDERTATIDWSGKKPKVTSAKVTLGKLTRIT